ncbi:MAG: helix-turn-helix transcriptional regulator [Alistipes sp.]|nr:helix-turn-helix transcriptional regulator [Alistipes sp.]
MRGYSIEKMALLRTKMEQMFVDSNDLTSRDVCNSSAVGCIINGSCKLRQDGALRVIPERMLYVIDQHTDSVENITNKEGSFEQVLLVVESNSGTTSTSSRERERFTNAIMQGIVYNLSIEELATMCCYSVSTFKRRFNQHFNESPHKWLLRCRLMLAAKIMSKTNISITELSSLCGFVNVSHFIATFRRHFGVTPSSLKVRPHEQ